MKALEAVEKNIGFTFHNKGLLQQALTHRSYINENKAWPVGNNERLEFLGDAVIEVAVRRDLLDRFPRKQEGELTEIQGALVSTRMLSRVAENLSLWDSMFLSRGERHGSDRARIFILGSAYEAVVAAIYLDQGEKTAHEFIRRTLLPLVLDIAAAGSLQLDPKSLFQEEAQGVVGITPHYRILRKRGPDHDSSFVVGAYLGSELISKGQGSSRKDAEVMAAQAALDIKGWLANHRRSRRRVEFDDD